MFGQQTLCSVCKTYVLCSRSECKQSVCEHMFAVQTLSSFSERLCLVNKRCVRSANTYVLCLRSECKHRVRSANIMFGLQTHVCSANAEFGLRKSTFGLRTLTFGLLTPYSVCEHSRSQCKRGLRSANDEFSLWTFTFGLRTHVRLANSCSVCEHYVQSANPHVRSANAEFDLRTLTFGLRTLTFGVQTPSLVCEPSRPESKR